MGRLYSTIFFGLVLAGLILQATNGDVYYVASKVSDCGHIDAHASCNTLDHYARSNTLRVSDSVLCFMPGKHFLRHTWQITGASNLTLTGQFPRSESSESDVVIECAGNMYHAILVSEGQNITVKNLAMLRCKSHSLSFRSTHYIKLCNLSLSSSKESSLCLELDLSSRYIITGSVFSHCKVAIVISGGDYGMLKSVRFLDNVAVLWVVFTKDEKSVNLQMDGIYSSGSTEGVDIQFCSLRYSLTSSYFTDSGPFLIRTHEFCVGEYTYGSMHTCVRYSNTYCT